MCLAAQRQLTAAWLSLAAILFAQLNPPVFSLITKSEPTQEAQMYVERLLPVLLQCGLGSLSMDGAMDAVGLFFIVSSQLMFISFGIESRYCTRIFLVHGQGESFQFIVIIDLFFSNRFCIDDRLPKILPAHSILCLQVYLMVLCSVPSKHYQYKRDTHLLRLVIFS